MMKTTVAMVCVLAAAACSKGGIDGALDKMESFKTQMCACKDVACVDKVDSDMEKWMDSNKDLKGKEPSKAQEERGDKIFDAMRECKDKVKGAAGEAKVAEAMGKMKGFADAMCACKDTACATKVSDEMTAWSQTMAKDAPDTKPTEAQMKEMTEVSTRMGECMQKAMMPADAAGSADATGSAGSAEGSAK
ncbi:MAG TPA: hypothetical protein VM513_15870 [Kofleriaceae bacterium]|jgi:hypothetical protein|nr:hypothetical protein [Kofleriaceae bacterium]